MQTARILDRAVVRFLVNSRIWLVKVLVRLWLRIGRICGGMDRVYVFLFLFPLRPFLLLLETCVCERIEANILLFFNSVSIPYKPESKRMDSEKLAKLLLNHCWTGHFPFLPFLISIHVCKRFAHLIK